MKKSLNLVLGTILIIFSVISFALLGFNKSDDSKVGQVLAEETEQTSPKDTTLKTVNVETHYIYDDSSQGELSSVEDDKKINIKDLQPEDPNVGSQSKLINNPKHLLFALKDTQSGASANSYTLNINIIFKLGDSGSNKWLLLIGAGQDSVFHGTFDGNYNFIKFDKYFPTYHYNHATVMGHLFQKVGSSATIKNLKFETSENVKLTYHQDAPKFHGHIAGTFIGESRGNIVNNSFILSGKIKQMQHNDSESFTGGIIGSIEAGKFSTNIINFDKILYIPHKLSYVGWRQLKNIYFGFFAGKIHYSVDFSNNFFTKQNDGKSSAINYAQFEMPLQPYKHWWFRIGFITAEIGGSGYFFHPSLDENNNRLIIPTNGEKDNMLSQKSAIKFDDKAYMYYIDDPKSTDFKLAESKYHKVIFKGTHFDSEEKRTTYYQGTKEDIKNLFISIDEKNGNIRYIQNNIDENKRALSVVVYNNKDRNTNLKYQNGQDDIVGSSTADATVVTSKDKNHYLFRDLSYLKDNISIEIPENGQYDKTDLVKDVKIQFAPYNVSNLYKKYDNNGDFDMVAAINNLLKLDNAEPGSKKPIVTKDSLSDAIVLSKENKQLFHINIADKVMSTSQNVVPRKITPKETNFNITKSKKWDGNNTATVTYKDGEGLGFIESDGMSIKVLTPVYDNENFGENKKISWGIELISTEGRTSCYEISTNKMEINDGVIEALIVEKPEAYNKVYDAQEHTFVSENDGYDISGKNIGTDTNDLNGSYRVTLTLKPGYKWNDGTTEQLVLDNKITKKNIDISLNNFSITKNKVYDATDDAEVTFNAVDGLYDVDGISIIISSKKYNDSTVAENKTITIDFDFDKSNPKYKNYNLSRNQIVVTECSISKKPLQEPKLNEILFAFDGEEKVVEVTPSNPAYQIVEGESILKSSTVGDYQVVVKLVDPETTVWVDAGNSENIVLKWAIAGGKVEIPNPQNIEYDGKSHTFISLNDGYDITGENSGKDPKEYSITLTLKPTYRWSDNTTEPLTRIVQILPKTITPTEANFNITKSKKYDGNNTATVTYKDGEGLGFIEEDGMSIKVTEAKFEDANYGDNKKITWNIALESSNDKVSNYKLSSNKMEINDGIIEAMIIDKPLVVEKEYTGETQTFIDSNEGYVIKGNNTGVDVDTYQTILDLATGYKWADGDTKSLVLDNKITKKQINISETNFDVTKIKEYDGSDNATVILNNYDTLGFILEDAIKLTVVGAHYDSANYGDSLKITWSISITSDKPNKANNYKLSKDTFEVNDGVINPKLLEKPKSVSKEYNSLNQKFIEENPGYSISGTNEAVDVNEYSVTLTLNEGYKWKDGSTDSLILNNIITKKQIEFTIDNFNIVKEKEYDGSDSANITFNSHEGIYVIDNILINVSAKYDSKNLGEGKTITWTFELDSKNPKANNYSLKNNTLSVEDGKINFANIEKPIAVSHVYNGEEQFFILENPNYIITGDNKGINVGVYKVTLSLKNKEVTAWSDGTLDDLELENKIIKKSITPTLDNFNVTKSKIYDGNNSADVKYKEDSEIGFFDTDNINIEITANFDNANYGTNKKIKWEIKLDGTNEKSNNYELAVTKFSIEDGEIKSIKVEKPVAKEITYNGEEHKFIEDNEGYVIEGENVAINSGEYIVNITLKEGREWNEGGNETIELLNKINKIEVNVNVENFKVTLKKVYDGTENATVEFDSSKQLPNVLDADNDIVLKVLIASYDNKNLGTDKTITWSFEFDSSNEKVKNYVLTVRSLSVSNGEITYNIVEKPEAVIVEYDGIKHQLVEKNSGYIINKGDEVVDGSGFLAGSYKFTLKLIENSEWSDGSKEDYELTSIIKQKNIEIVLDDFNVEKVKEYDYNDIARIEFKNESLNKYFFANDHVQVIITDNKFVDNKVGNNKKISWKITINGEGLDNYKLDTEKIFSIEDGEITSKKVEKPHNVIRVYNGSEIKFIKEESGYNIRGDNKGVNVGEYEVTLSLQENYIWSDGDESSFKITNEIVQKEINIKVIHFDVTKKKMYDGNDSTTVKYIKDSEVGFYDKDKISVNVVNAKYDSKYIGQGKIITWTIEITSEKEGAVDNYKLTNTDFSVDNCEITGNKVDKPSRVEFTYNGKERSFIKENDNYIIEGNNKGTESGEYKVTIRLNDGYVWSDGTTDDLNLDNKINQKTINVNINMFKVTKDKYFDNTQLANVVFSENYDKTKLGFIEADEMNLEIVNPRYEDRNFGSNKKIIWDLKLTSMNANNVKNYILNTDSLWINDGKISKIFVELPTVKNTQFVYDGNEKQVIVILPERSKEWVNIEGIANTEVGKYNVKIYLKDPINTIWIDNDIQPKVFNWEINRQKIDVDLSHISVSDIKEITEDRIKANITIKSNTGKEIRNTDIEKIEFEVNKENNKIVIKNIQFKNGVLAESKFVEHIETNYTINNEEDVKKHTKNKNNGAVIGGAVGGVVGLLLIGFAVALILKRKKK